MTFVLLVKVSLFINILLMAWNSRNYIALLTDQECYEHVKNAKTSHTTQLATESISVESTEEKVYQSTSVTPMENSARLVQNIDNQNTMSHM